MSTKTLTLAMLRRLCACEEALDACGGCQVFSHSEEDSQMAAQVSRDPFARTTLVRIVVGGYSCDWCGGARVSAKGRRTLYRYITQGDGGGESVHRGKFCTKSCHDSYHA